MSLINTDITLRTTVLRMSSRPTWCGAHHLYPPAPRSTFFFWSSREGVGDDMENSRYPHAYMRGLKTLAEQLQFARAWRQHVTMQMTTLCPYPALCKLPSTHVMEKHGPHACHYAHGCFGPSKTIHAYAIVPRGWPGGIREKSCLMLEIIYRRF